MSERGKKLHHFLLQSRGEGIQTISEGFSLNQEQKQFIFNNMMNSRSYWHSYYYITPVAVEAFGRSTYIASW